jgi:glycosyltransferase involved in cell wall biosynthesis
MNRLAYELADVVIANSARVARKLVQSESVAPDRVSVVSNFIDESAFVPPAEGVQEELLDELHIEKGSRVVGIIANLRPVKDHATLLQAIRLLRDGWPDLRLVVVGAGECEDDLKALASDLGIPDRVRFAGLRPVNPNLHHLFEISVLCSLKEASSNSIIEAMAAGNPVVATDIGGNADLVLDGVTGFLVPPSDPCSLATAIETLLRNPGLRQTMGAAGQRRAREFHNPRAALSSLESLYEQLASKHCF